MKDMVIVSVGVDGREKYSEKAKILKSTADKFGYSNMIYINKYPPNCPSHKEVPYGFKIFAIEEAIKAGHKKILWLDSPCKIIKSLDPIYDLIEKDGYFFTLDGWNVGQWCKDTALRPLGISRDQAFRIPVIVAKHFGFDVSSKKFMNILDKMKNLLYENNGDVYRGAWTNNNREVSYDKRVLGHRHDQTVISVLAYQENIEIKDYNDFIEWGVENKVTSLIRFN